MQRAAKRVRQLKESDDFPMASDELEDPGVAEKSVAEES
jgi:hypothetical protein